MSPFWNNLVVAKIMIKGSLLTDAIFLKELGIISPSFAKASVSTCLLLQVLSLYSMIWSDSVTYQHRSSHQRCSLKRCFPANFAKLLRTPFLTDTSGGCFCQHYIKDFFPDQKKSVASDSLDFEEDNNTCVCTF